MTANTDTGGTLDSAWRPTRTATAVTVLVTAAMTALVATLLDIVVALGFAWLSAISLGGAAWFATRFRWQLIGTYLAGLLLAPLGLGVTVGLAYTGLTLAGSLFPQPTTAQSAAAILSMLAQLFVVAGVTVAVIGAVGTAVDVLSQSSLGSVWSVGYRTASVPLLAAGGLAASAVLGNVELASLNQTVAQTVQSTLDTTTSVVLSPGASSPHLTSLSGLLVIAALGVNRALDVLPLTELLGPQRASMIRTLRRHTLRAAYLGIIGVLVGVCTDFLIPVRVFRTELGPTAYQTLGSATVLTPVRMAFVVATGVSLAAIIVSWLLKRIAASSPSTATTDVGSLASGITIAAAALPLHNEVVWRVQSFIVTNLPDTMTGTYQRLSESVIAYYGTLTLALAGTAAVAVITVCLIVVLRMGVWLRMLPKQATGPALAGTGLFIATAFAGTQSLPPLVFLAGILASFLAWDAGRFGRTLGTEIGRRAHTRNAEATHLSATLIIGVAAVALALLVLNQATELTAINPTSVQAATAGIAGSLFLLVFAAR
jgi:hypothetical protein